MKKLIVGSLASVLASAGLAVAQGPAMGPGFAAPAARSAVSTGDPLKSDVVVPLNGESTGGCCGTPHWHDVVEPAGQCYGGLEYLLWWSKKGSSAVPLATTGSENDNFPGALGQQGTVSLLGAGRIFDYEATSGARMTIGYWFDRQGSIGIEGRGMVLEQRSSHHHLASNGSGAPLLGNPFFNTSLGREDFYELAVPLIATGFVDVSSTSQIYGGEANFVSNLYRDECWNVEIFGGFRYVGLDESVTISDATTAAPGFSVTYLNTVFPPPAITTVTDKFETYNHFFGGQLGGRFDYKTSNVLLGLGARVALGVVHETVDVNGYSSLHVGPVGPVSQTGGGIFALGSNSGRRSDNVFAVVPEVEAKIGYEFNCHLSAHVGYTFLYMSDVVRPGDQIDHNVNPNRVPTFIEFGQPGGGNFPGPRFEHSDYWIHGLSFGVEVKF